MTEFYGYSDTVTIPNAATSAAAATQGPNVVEITWNDNSTDEDGFKIHRATGSTPGAFSLWYTAGTNDEATADLGVVGGTYYTYRVYAYNTAGDAAYSQSNTVLAV